MDAWHNLNGPIPDFKLDSIPDICIRSLHIQNFKAYSDWHMDFSDGSNCKPFVCFVGDNGIGKSTALNAIQLLFTRYEGYSPERMGAMLGKHVRHIQYGQNGVYSSDNFLIEAEIQSSLGNYTVSLNKYGFVQDHPEEIKSIVYRLCYYARFDQDLHKFQLVRSQWAVFQKLFESVTGFKAEEMVDVFSVSEDPIQKDLMEKYVLSFTVQKPHETILHKECSNGERKVIKSFSTMLNLEIQPKIILIDDIAMHVALGRHLPLIDAMQSCYPTSQIFSTAHSYRMTKCLKIRSQIYDLRRIHANEIIAKEHWRLYMIDEINDALDKLDGLNLGKGKSLYDAGEKLRDACYTEISDLQQFKTSVSNFLKEVSDLFVIGVLSC